MAILPETLDYTDRDFESVLERLKSLAQSVFPDWTNFDQASFDTVLLELFAFVGDVLSFYLDAEGRESRWTTARRLRSAIAIAKLVGFRPAGTEAARATVTISLASPPAAEFRLPVGQTVRTEDRAAGVAFEILEEAVIPAASDPPSVDVLAENSIGRAEVFQSDGLPNQRFLLSRSPYVNLSVAVLAGNGAYSEVSSLLSSGATDRHFVAALDGNDQITLIFGNGINGAIPVGTISASYRTGGGSEGNVNAGDINTIDGSFADAAGNAVSVSINNAQVAAGGGDRDNIEEFKAKATASVVSLNRTVSFDDFSNNARLVSGVARAMVLTSDQSVGIPENSGLLFIIPEGGGLPSQALKDQVAEFLALTRPTTITFRLTVSDPLFKTIDVTARVFRAPGFNKASARADIENALGGFFQITNADGSPNLNVRFGLNYVGADGISDPSVSWSNLQRVVDAAASVRKVGDGDDDFLLNGFSDDVVLLDREFPTLGTVTLIDGQDGQPF